MPKKFVQRLKFEGSVIPYGRKTRAGGYFAKGSFEGSVIPYGRKTFKM